MISDLYRKEKDIRKIWAIFISRLLYNIFYIRKYCHYKLKFGTVKSSTQRPFELHECCLNEQLPDIKKEHDNDYPKRRCFLCRLASSGWF